jgi:hypothetical protein
MKTLAALFLVSILSGSATAQSAGQIYKGKYFYNFEISTFTQEGSDQPWCVNSTDMEKAQIPSNRRVAIVVRGELSPEGRYCNLGAFKRILKVYEIIEVSSVQPGE